MRLGHMQEVFLRETAVSWIRLRLASTVPSKAWLETKEQYICSRHRGAWTTSMRMWVSRVCAKASQKRLDLVIEAKGGRRPK